MEENEDGTLTAWGLVILVIWEEIVQSLFTGVRVLLFLRERKGVGSGEERREEKERGQKEDKERRYRGQNEKGGEKGEGGTWGEGGKS